MLAAVIALSCGVLPMVAVAEEASEHLMAAVPGTQISGYVRTSFTWTSGRPVYAAELLYWHGGGGVSSVRVLPALRAERVVPTGPFPELPPRRIEAVEILDPPSRRAATAYAPVPVDVSHLRSWHQAPGSAGFELAAVPEPGTMMLLGIGAVGAWCRFRRHKIP